MYNVQTLRCMWYNFKVHIIACITRSLTFMNIFQSRGTTFVISITFHNKDTFWQYRLQVQTHSCTTDTSLDDSYNRMIPGKVIQIFCTFLAFSYHNIALRRSIKTLNSIRSFVLPWIMVLNLMLGLGIIHLPLYTVLSDCFQVIAYNHNMLMYWYPCGQRTFLSIKVMLRPSTDDLKTSTGREKNAEKLNYHIGFV